MAGQTGALKEYRSITTTPTASRLKSRGLIFPAFPNKINRADANSNKVPPIRADKNAIVEFIHIHAAHVVGRKGSDQKIQQVGGEKNGKSDRQKKKNPSCNGKKHMETTS